MGVNTPHPTRLCFLSHRDCRRCEQVDVVLSVNARRLLRRLVRVVDKTYVSEPCKCMRDANISGAVWRRQGGVAWASDA